MQVTVVNEPRLLEQAAELANQGRFDEGIAACERHLRIKGFSAAAYHLMGMIFHAAGSICAEECFTKRSTSIRRTMRPCSL